MKFDLHIHSIASKYKESSGIVDKSTVENIGTLFKKLEEEISKSNMKEFFLSSQILTPTKKGILGTENLNKEIQEIYNTYEKQKFKTFRKSRNKRKR